MKGHASMEKWEGHSEKIAQMISEEVVIDGISDSIKNLQRYELDLSRAWLMINFYCTDSKERDSSP